MYRCTGWCVLHVTPVGWTDAADTASHRALKKACAILERTWAHQFGHFALTWINAEPLLVCSCAGNHGRHMQGALPDMARHIAKLAPRSYGVFQICDDEVRDDGECVVTMIRLVGEAVTVEEDTALTAFVRHTDDLGREPE